jgi:hypothetical protein
MLTPTQFPEEASFRSCCLCLPQKPLIEIPEEEQWRIIKQTGILDAAKLQDQTVWWKKEYRLEMKFSMQFY